MAKYWCDHCNEEPLFLKGGRCMKCGNNATMSQTDEGSKDSFFYLASPYSHPDITMLEQRYQAALKATNYLMKRGTVVFSPIVHCHMVAMTYGLPTVWSFWEKYDTIFLTASKGLIVLEMDGWKESTGVTNEIKIARNLDKPVIMLSYSEVLRNE